MIKSEFEKFYLSMHHYGRSTLDGYEKRVQNITPYVMDENPIKGVQLDVFSALQKSRIVYLIGEINQESASILEAQWLWLSSQSQERIQVYISSGGGSVMDGNGLLGTVDEIYDRTGVQIDMTVTSMAASFAAVLLSHATGTRRCLSLARIMLHQPLGGFGSGLTKASDMEIETALIMDLKRELYEILAHNCHKEVSEIYEACSKGDFWMNSKEALEFGIIDEIIPGRFDRKK